MTTHPLAPSYLAFTPTRTITFTRGPRTVVLDFDANQWHYDNSANGFCDDDNDLRDHFDGLTVSEIVSAYIERGYRRQHDGSEN